MISKAEILQHLPPFLNNQNIISEEQTTSDIINGIKHTHEKFAWQYDKIYRFFVGTNTKQTCQNIFDFLKDNVKYFVEPGSRQTLRSPSAILHAVKGADCKSFALFSAGILSAMQRHQHTDFKIKFCFAGYGDKKNIEHVFCVCDTPNGEYWIDPVLSYFNSREQTPNFVKNINIKPMLVQVNGINNQATQQQNFYGTMQRVPAWQFVGKNYESVGRAKINGGLFGGALLQQFKDLLPKIDIAFLYLTVNNTYIPNDSFNIQANQLNVYFTSIAANKRLQASACFEEIHSQMDSVITTEELYKLLVQSLTQKLGMSPRQFWAKWFGISSINGIDDEDIANNIPIPGFDLFSTGLTTITNLFNSLAPDLRFQPALQTFSPSLNDWAGTPYPKDKTLQNIATGTPAPTPGPPAPTPGTPGEAKTNPLIPLGLGVLAIKLLM